MANPTRNGTAAGPQHAPGSGNPVPTTIGARPAALAPAAPAPAPSLHPSPFTLHPHSGRPALRLWLRSRTGLVSLGLAGLAGLLLVVDHWAHVLGAAPYLLLAACPLLHLFMHGGHGSHGGGQGNDPTKPER